MTLRVVQLVPALGDGGVERSAVEMARYLGARGVPNWLASDDGPLCQPLRAAGAHHVALPVGRKTPAAVLRNARRLARLIDENGITVVHARSRVPAWVGWFATRMARAGPVFVTTFHGTYGHGSRLKRLYNGIMFRGPVVIANSRFIAAHIQSVYGVPERRIVVAPRGIDTAVFDPALVSAATVARLREEFAAADVPLLVKVARISPWKGHAALIEALSRLRQRPWRLVLVGGGDDRARARLEGIVARFGLENRVLLAGSRNDVADILRAADLAFSLADSVPEAFGRAAIEAAAMETPVIATGHGGSLETVVPGETGWLVPPGDVSALADAIRDALDDPARRAALGKAGRRYVLENFDLETTLAKEFSVYCDLLGDRRARGA